MPQLFEHLKIDFALWLRPRITEQSCQLVLLLRHSTKAVTYAGNWMLLLLLWWQSVCDWQCVTYSHIIYIYVNTCLAAEICKCKDVWFNFAQIDKWNGLLLLFCSCSIYISTMEDQGEKIKDDFLTCPLCLELYTEPKVLNCQHTFCLQCLRQYMQCQSAAQKNCCCPLCKELTVIPSNDVQNLKNNFLVIGLLQCFNSQSGPKGRCFGLPSKGPGESCPACEVSCLHLLVTGSNSRKYIRIPA